MYMHVHVIKIKEENRKRSTHKMKEKSYKVKTGSDHIKNSLDYTWSMLLVHETTPVV